MIRNCIDIKNRACVTSASPVEAIYYEDDLPESLQPYTEENVKFFNHDR